MGFLDIAKKAKLSSLKDSLLGGSGSFALSSLTKVIGNVDLSNISLGNLKSISDPVATQGLDWNSLDLNTMDSDKMNEVAPGSIDVPELNKKLADSSLVKGKTTELVDTQSGMLATSSEVKTNEDMEDTVTAKTQSQGTNMQMINRSSQFKPTTSQKEITSNYIGRDMVG